MNKLEPLLTERQDAVRRGNYEIIGTVSLFETEHGVMRFPDESGPTVGFVVEKVGEQSHINKAKLVCLTPWQGLPATREVTNTPCTACTRECDVCDKEGTKLCEAPKCGGAGYELDDKGNRTENPCPHCQATGRMKCPACRGTRKVATGLENGDTDYRKPKCKTCLGTKFQATAKTQDLAQFINAQIGELMIVGPIFRMVVVSIPGTSAIPTRVFEISPDPDGDYLVLVIEPTQAVPRAYLLGGIMTETSRSTGR